MKPPKKMLIWLPSPLGDAICATPALRAFRERFADSRITFLAAPFTQAILSPTPFADAWLTPQKGLLPLVRQLRAGRFDAAILLKNSFGSVLTVVLAGIPQRVGYARDGRSLLLTDGLKPSREKGRFQIVSSVDYYLNLAAFLGGMPQSRLPELEVAEADKIAAAGKLPTLFTPNKPLVVIVPGGAFGPSKLWPYARFGACAEAIVEKYNANVVLSVAPTAAEMQAADSIAAHCRHPLVNLAKTPLSGGQLKALFARADLVLTNDTGPRHIAIALRRKIVTLFGPNNPARTHTGYADEIRIIGKGDCVPCDKPECKAAEHYCMQSITVDQVLDAVHTQMAGGRGE